MRYPVLLVADPHFTSNPRDEYRWGLWDWLRDKCKRGGVRTVCFLGDLTDAKDFHPSSLVNRLAFEVRETSQLARLYFIPGNHEWLKRGEEFWRFLAYMGDNVHYLIHPSDDPVPHNDGPIVRFLPFTKTPGKDWAGMNFEDYDLVFMHQTVRGSRASNGEEMEGEDVPLEALCRAGYVFSGDIHVPQRIGKNFEYVGSPYHVHFGDSFRPRCVLLPSKHRNDWEDLRYPSPRRLALEVTSDLEALSSMWKDEALTKGDQVKLRVRLEPTEKFTWKTIRREALAVLRGLGVEVQGLEMIVAQQGRRRLPGASLSSANPSTRPQDDVLRYVTREELGADALDAAMEVIES